ncbi:c-type cytochrome [Sediminitomix flava]|uniref:Cbb3-type cytochrome c oxidase subunit III n=1 Tax=Sediminitomix flava TaxID=379075 RepID=A0A316A0D5_SEDFL|nr:cytochrome c [Sediminitomix flava]PWJ43107.1 cbb3-type cytochrome c oxidase subunit III [Sediminitomix flava]
MRFFSNKLAGLCLIGAVALTGCSADGNDPGVEYAPQMYHSVPYEPLTQITGEEIPTSLGAIAYGVVDKFYGADENENYYKQFINSLPYNDYNGKVAINVKKPVEGTVARQNFTSVTGANEAQPDQLILDYSKYGKEDIELAAAELVNPLTDKETVSTMLKTAGKGASDAELAAFDKDLVKDGKALYTSYCQPCHGAEGNGKGKVGVVFKGVANLKGNAVKTASDGHIFHVITHGRGRMWAHKSQINPEERWKIVRYVRTLQGK